jgi:hypothetical protein
VRRRTERGVIRNASQAVCGVAAIFVSGYGFERVWVAAYQAGLPLWGVRSVAGAFVAAVTLGATYILAPALQVLLERVVASRTARADEGGVGS